MKKCQKKGHFSNLKIGVFHNVYNVILKNQLDILNLELTALGTFFIKFHMWYNLHFNWKFNILIETVKKNFSKRTEKRTSFKVWSQILKISKNFNIFQAQRRQWVRTFHHSNNLQWPNNKIHPSEAVYRLSLKRNILKPFFCFVSYFLLKFEVWKS